MPLIYTMTVNAVSMNPSNDSALAATRYLCTIGGDLMQPGRWIVAVATYNDTVEYNNLVADAADHYASFG